MRLQARSLLRATPGLLVLALGTIYGLSYLQWPEFAVARSAPLPLVGYYTGGLKPWGNPTATDFAPTVELSGSRGEILNFTLRVRSGPCVEPQLTWIPVNGMARPLALEVKFYEILPFTTQHPSYRGARTGIYWDPVIPRKSICPSKEGAWVLGEIRIPRDSPTGKFSGKVSLGSSSLPLQLKIWHMEIPVRPSVPLYSELTTWFLLLGHFGKWHEGEVELAQKYEASMIDHRIVPFKHWIRPLDTEPGPLDLRKVKGVKASDSFYSAAVKPLPDWAKISVPLDSHLNPEDVTTPEKITQLSEALNHEGWLERSFAYLWDEPTPKDLPALKKLAALVRKHAPGLKILVTMVPEAGLENLVDIFVPIMDSFDEPGSPPPSRYSELQQAGKEVWLYASCVSHGCGNDVDSGAPDWVIDRPGTHIRAQGWLAQKYRLNALLYYSVNNGYQFFSKGRDPWKDLWDFSGNGDGTLYFPGRPGMLGLQENVPVETLRLKLWRQSSYDADYAQLINQAAHHPDWWPRKLNALIRSPHDWEHADAAYRDLREQIGDYLDQPSK